ncbi:hypothetical protein [Sneathia sanguinegens]|uniref:hypothetical protein n=1 Tax=Sneathia sanguinegens TaxID=40543 RepID=UPI00258D9061|nr:hypothetical protein [Sneathia sanguinegens]MDU4652602.1 hypothetical protein [Sneathia sanguinegens]
MITIKTKNKTFSGVVANVVFVMGEGKVSTLTEDDKAWFKKYGAEIIEESEDEQDKKSKTSKTEKE